MEDSFSMEQYRRGANDYEDDNFLDDFFEDEVD